MRKNKRRHIKFTPPTGDGLYARERLLARLSAIADQGRHHWIGGPPGSGKTALAATLLARVPRQVVWYRVEPADRDARAFIQHLYLAAGRKATGSDPLSTDEERLSQSLHEIFGPLPDLSLWVWDNCEHIPADAPHWQALATLMEHTPGLPPMLFTSREPPPSAFRRLQVGQRLEIVSWPDLRLQADEAAEIVSRVSRDPRTARFAQQWHELSDGWIAALVLLTQQAGTGPGQTGEMPADFFDYLAGELMRQADADPQQRLMRLSVLPFIPVEVARETLQDPDADRHLQEIARRWHLVERSGETPPVYRLHPLLHRFMQEQLEQRLPPEVINGLRRRGARSLEEFGLPEAACDLYSAAGDWPEVLRLALTLAEPFANTGRFQELLTWLTSIPAEVAATTPWHGYWLGCCLRFSNRAEGWPLLEAAFERFRRDGDVIGQYSAWLALVEGMLAVFDDINPLKHWLAEYEALRERHPRCPDMALRLKCLALAGSVMSMVAPRHPKLARLIRIAEIAVRLIPFKAPRQGIFVYLILHYASTGQVARLHAMARHLLPDIEDLTLPAQLRVFAYAMIGLFQFFAGEEAPEKLIEEGVKLSDRLSDRLIGVIPRTYLIYLEVTEGRLAEARASLRRLIDNQLIPPDHRMQQAAHDLIGAWISITEGDDVNGLALSDQSLSLTRRLGFDFGIALNNSLRSQALARLGEYEAARLELEELGRITADGESTLLAVMHGIAASWLALCRDGEAAACRQLAPTLQLAEREGILAYTGFLRPMIAELALVAIRNDLSVHFVERVVRRWRLHPDSLTPLDIAWPWGLRVRTLGRYEVTLGDGSRLGFEQSAHRRPLELLACLITLGGRNVPKSRLTDYLWPDTDADKASHALDNLLYRLRKLVGGELLRIDASLVSLDPERCWVDAWALDNLQAQMQRASLESPQASLLLKQLYNGDFMLGEEQEWLHPERERLRALFSRLAEKQAGRLTAQNQHHQAIELLESALRHAPLAEGLYLQLMKTSVELGRQVEARAAYQRCIKTLAHQLGAEPGDELRAYAESLMD